MSADPVGGADWRNRVVLLTGASGGLGRALAARLSALGSELILLARRPGALARIHDELEEACGRRPALYPLDFERAAPNDYDALAQTLEREFGRIDVLLHAAAHFPGLTPLEYTDPIEWLRGLHVNLSAPLFLTMACLPLLRCGHRPQVVFTLDAIDCARRPLHGAYGIAKGALAELAMMLDRELDASGIRVLAVRLPPMRTALRARAWLEDPTPAFEPAACAVALLDRLNDAGCRGIVELPCPVAVGAARTAFNAPGT